MKSQSTLRLPSAWRAAGIGAVLFALAGCQSVPVTSLPALSRVDPFSLDGQHLAAAVVHGPDLRLSTGAVRLSMTLSERGGPVVAREEFVLISEDAPADLPRGEGGSAAVFSLASGDLARFEAFQALLRQRRDARTGQNSFALGVNLKPCATGPDAADFSTTTYLKVSADSGYIAVNRGLALTDPNGDGLPQC